MTTETLQWIIWGCGLLYGALPAICINSRWAGCIIGIVAMFFCVILSSSLMAEILRELHIGI